MNNTKKNSDARLRTNKKYDLKWTRMFSFKVSRKYSPEVIKKLDSVPNKAEYITSLIKADIKKSQPTVQSVIDDARKYSGYLPLQIFATTNLKEIYDALESDDMTAEEAADLLSDDTWVRICSDGVVILADMHDADFEWNGTHYIVKNDKWTEE